MMMMIGKDSMMILASTETVAKYDICEDGQDENAVMVSLEMLRKQLKRVGYKRNNHGSHLSFRIAYIECLHPFRISE